jgi:hypothetical protein
MIGLKQIIQVFYKIQKKYLILSINKQIYKLCKMMRKIKICYKWIIFNWMNAENIKIIIIIINIHISFKIIINNL